MTGRIHWIRPALLIAGLVVGTSFYRGNAVLAAVEDSYLIAKTGQALSEEVALALVREGRYKMTQVREDSGLVTLLYVQAQDLSDHMPPHVVAAMARMDAGIDPGARWLGRALPEFSLADLDGEQVESARLQGKVVVINFWFMACSPCIREMPILSQLEERYRLRDDVVFLALSFDDAESIRKLLDQREFSYRQLTAPGEWFVEAGIDTYPTHLVVGRGGIIQGAIAGLDDPASLLDQLDGMVRNALND
jgi:thiol-disulfide isomerase/thioredoxin